LACVAAVAATAPAPVSRTSAQLIITTHNCTCCCQNMPWQQQQLQQQQQQSTWVIAVPGASPALCVCAMRLAPCSACVEPMVIVLILIANGRVSIE
jgi:hypothetical protein